MNNKTNSLCRVCHNNILSFMNFGKMPIANRLIDPKFKKDFKEYTYEMKTAVCDNCGCFQVTEVPDKNLMFNNSYPYFASQSKEMVSHFNKLSKKIIDDFFKSKDDYILDIGCNDGILLKNFSTKNLKHLGIDASANLVEAAKKNGLNVINKFFDENLAKKIFSNYGKAKVITLTNTMHHIENCNTVAAGIKELLSDDGILIIEDPYLVDMFNLGSFEQIYAEHNFIWSISAYEFLFKKYSINLYDVEHFDKHGGSMRYFFSKKSNKKTEELIKYQNLENQLNLNKTSTLIDFKKKSEKICLDLKNFIVKKKEQGLTIAGYGATAKSTTTLNFMNVNNLFISCIYDSTPFKIGKLTPGTYIPIKDPKFFNHDSPDYTILFAWNHKDEILKKEKLSGSKTIWVEYIPKLKFTDEN